MDVTVTSFGNPFSFFCLIEDAAKEKNPDVALNTKDLPLHSVNGQSDKTDISAVNHGQYVAVLWNKKWARGVITLEDQFLIWLVDYGFYVHVDNNTVYVTLPTEYKKLPTKVFEASIHGVTPLCKELNMMCQIVDKPSINWDNWVVTKSVELISSADKVIFAPIAILSTKNNDVVLGDLYLKKGKQILNFTDELEKWPGCLEKNPKNYIEKLSALYAPYRRKHRTCLLKPVFSNMSLATITPYITLNEYTALCEASKTVDASDDDSVDGSTITYIENRPSSPHAFKLTAEEIEKYANAYITISGREYNVLNVLLNKIRDLNICEQFKDAKSVGRATTRKSRFPDNPQ